MLVVSQEPLKRESLVRSGHPFSSKLWTLKALHHHGTLILLIYTKTQSCINQMLRSGVSITASGPDKHWRSSQHIHDGFIFQLTRYHSTTYSQDLRDNSQAISTYMQMDLKDHCLTGCTSTQMVMWDNYLQRWQTGWDGRMDVMSYSQTSQKQVGTIFLTEVSATRQAPHTANTTPNMSIITICIRMNMSYQERQEAKKRQLMVNSCQ